MLQTQIMPGMPEGPSSQVLGGSETVLLDLQNGLMLSRQSVQMLKNERITYKLEVNYQLKRMSYGQALDTSLFQLPEGMQQVKKLSSWNITRIKKELVGKPAPELHLTDIQGKPVDLSDLKGRTVLLDFWTTWCPPCRADAPALDKLYNKYGDRDLMIVGISVSEDRALVEKFLNAHPHPFPIVLTTENEMPRPYQISSFPT